MDEQLILEGVTVLNTYIVSTLEKDCPVEYEFSNKYKRKMRRIIRIGNAPLRYQIQRSFIRAACILILSFLTLMMISPSARAAVITWIKEQYNIYTKYTFNGDTEEETYQYELTYIPEGYAPFHYIKKAQQITQIYYNSQSGKTLYFHQANNLSANAYYFDSSEYQEKNTQIRNGTGTIFQATVEDIANAIIWVDEESSIVLIISGHETTAELNKIIEGAKKK